jgi:SAM-dependent methyltransferase
MSSTLVEDVNTAARRKESERQFHNDRFGAEHDVRQKLDKWYRAVAAGTEAQNALVRLHGQNSNILEYGCADGRISLVYDHLADGAAKFCGIDISDRAIDVARVTAQTQGLAHCEFTVMDAEHTTFPDGAFDVVFGHGILHHLDLAKCFPEIARILRPGGHAIFTEPLGHNPALNLYRKLTPRLRTPDEHPLLMADLRRARTYFSRVDPRGPVPENVHRPHADENMRADRQHPAAHPAGEPERVVGADNADQITNAPPRHDEWYVTIVPPWPSLATPKPAAVKAPARLIDAAWLPSLTDSTAAAGEYETWLRPKATFVRSIASVGVNPSIVSPFMLAAVSRNMSFPPA